MIAKVKELIPWQAKIALKVLLSRIPVGYGFWQRLGVFRAGTMDDPQQAFGTFQKHYQAASQSRKEGLVILELGPGDSVATAIIGYAIGASRVYLVDVGENAVKDMAFYRKLAGMLSSIGLKAPNLDDINTFDEMLEVLNASYLTDGLNSLRQIPDGSVDFIFSNAVLEHVRKREFMQTIYELRRIIMPTGVCSHVIDLRDHLSEALNNLRFSESVWESEFFANSGFYTNRIGCSGMLEIFQEAGFSSSVISETKWSNLPTPKEKLSSSFRRLPDEELLVSVFHVLLYPRPH